MLARTILISLRHRFAVVAAALGIVLLTTMPRAADQGVVWTDLVNVTVSHKGLRGLVVLPGPWFRLTVTIPRTGTISLAKRDFEGHSYAMTAAFAAPPDAVPQRTAPSAGGPGQR